MPDAFESRIDRLEILVEQHAETLDFHARLLDRVTRVQEQQTIALTNQGLAMQDILTILRRIEEHLRRPGANGSTNA